jgi:hypothetical protein
VRDVLVVIAKSMFWVLVVLGIVLVIAGVIQDYHETGFIPKM